MDKNFSSLLGIYIDRSGKKKKDIAQYVGVTPEYIRMCVTGQNSPPTYDKCKLIADALSLNLDERVELYKAAFGERTSSENGYKEELRKYKQKMQDKVDLW